MRKIENHIIEKHAVDHGIEFEEAQKTFDRLTTFLQRCKPGRASPTMEVDSAWHTFILHTREYTDYCVAEFGRYIHHTPNPNPSKPGLAGCS